MNTIILTVIAAVSVAILDALFRYSMQKKIRVTAIAWYNFVVAGLLILLVNPLPSLAGITFPVVGFLLLSSTLWALQSITDIKAFEGLSLSVNAILGAAGVVLINAAGLYLFNESASLLQISGICVIISSMLIGVNFRKVGELKGSCLRAVSVLAGALALVIDKHLMTLVSPQLVLVSGYLLPAALMSALYSSELRSLGSELRAHPIVMHLMPILYAAIGYCLIYSIGLGDLWETISLYQLKIVFSFVIGFSLLKERERLAVRLCAAALTLAGSGLIIFG